MIYAVSPIIQKDLVDKLCFGACGKISVAGIDLGEWGPACPCRHDDCPYEDKRTDIIGQAFDEDVCVRKLKEVEI